MNSTPSLKRKRKKGTFEITFLRIAGCSILLLMVFQFLVWLYILDDNLDIYTRYILIIAESFTLAYFAIGSLLASSQQVAPSTWVSLSFLYAAKTLVYYLQIAPQMLLKTEDGGADAGLIGSIRNIGYILSSLFAQPAIYILLMFRATKPMFGSLTQFTQADMQFHYDMLLHVCLDLVDIADMVQWGRLQDWFNIDLLKGSWNQFVIFRQASSFFVFLGILLHGLSFPGADWRFERCMVTDDLVKKFLYVDTEEDEQGMIDENEQSSPFQMDPEYDEDHLSSGHNEDHLSHNADNDHFSPNAPSSFPIQKQASTHSRLAETNLSPALASPKIPIAEDHHKPLHERINDLYNRPIKKKSKNPNSPSPAAAKHNMSPRSSKEQNVSAASSSNMMVRAGAAPSSPPKAGNETGTTTSAHPHQWSWENWGPMSKLAKGNNSPMSSPNLDQMQIANQRSSQQSKDDNMTRTDVSLSDINLSGDNTSFFEDIQSEHFDSLDLTDLDLTNDDDSDPDGAANDQRRGAEILAAQRVDWSTKPTLRTQLDLVYARERSAKVSIFVVDLPFAMLRSYLFMIQLVHVSGVIDATTGQEMSVVFPALLMKNAASLLFQSMKLYLTDKRKHELFATLLIPDEYKRLECLNQINNVSVEYVTFLSMMMVLPNLCKVATKMCFSTLSRACCFCCESSREDVYVDEDGNTPDNAGGASHQQMQVTDAQFVNPYGVRMGFEKRIPVYSDDMDFKVRGWSRHGQYCFLVLIGWFFGMAIALQGNVFGLLNPEAATFTDTQLVGPPEYADIESVNTKAAEASSKVNNDDNNSSPEQGTATDGTAAAARILGSFIAERDLSHVIEDDF